MNQQQIIEVIKLIANAMSEKEKYLNELDTVIGDGDHGRNMVRGFQAVISRLDDLKNMDIGDMLKAIGEILTESVKGVSSELYSICFRNAGTVLMGKYELTMQDFLYALQDAIDGVMLYTNARYGEKTMLDAMIPAIEEMKVVWDHSNNAVYSLREGLKAAQLGVEYTKQIAAAKGIAMRIGDAGLEHQDPGATSFTYMLEVIEEQAEVYKEEQELLKNHA